MEQKYILRIGFSIFEPIRKNSNTFQTVQDGSKFMNVEDIDQLFWDKIWFENYKTESGKIVGAVFGCDYGNGAGFDNGDGRIEMKPGDKAQFSREGTSVDDEGDPEDYTVDYYLELYDWDNTLLTR